MELSLTKSFVTDGLQCLRKVWLHRHPPEGGPLRSEFRKFLTQRNRELIRLAQQIHPGGTTGHPDREDPSAGLNRTSSAKRDGHAVIYDATVEADGIRINADILEKHGQKWNLYSVRASTGIRDHYITDTALQYHVLMEAGWEIAGIFIIHINTNYLLVSTPDPRKLLKTVQVKKMVMERRDAIREFLPGVKEAWNQANKPFAALGPYCLAPHECPFKFDCWQELPSPSVFDIMHLDTSKKFDLYRRGIIRFEDIPESFSLNPAQQIQVQSSLEGRRYVQWELLKTWLAGLRFPIQFLDFECFQPAIPLYELTHPFQQMPCQFSLHIVPEKNAEPLHRFFLGDPLHDPRPDFIKHLLDALPPEGTILVYNLDFEKERLEELAADFPYYRKALIKVLTRMKDLMEPFREKWIYDPGMQGSHSIKQVLPALVADLSFENLDIADGFAASVALERLYRSQDESEKARIRENLLRYSKTDTEAMYRIWLVLEQEISHA